MDAETTGGINIFFTHDQLEKIRKKGHRATAGEIKKTVCRWQGLVTAGEKELAAEFDRKEQEIITNAIIKAVRIDQLNNEEFWGMNAERIGGIIEICADEPEIGERCLELSELAIIAIKERVAEVVNLPTGKGGRKKKT